MKRHKKYTKQDCINEAKKYESKIKFKYGSPSIYNKTIRDKIIDEVCSHMIKIIKIKPYCKNGCEKIVYAKEICRRCYRKIHYDEYEREKLGRKNIYQ